MLTASKLLKFLPWNRDPQRFRQLVQALPMHRPDRNAFRPVLSLACRLDAARHQRLIDAGDRVQITDAPDEGVHLRLEGVRLGEQVDTQADDERPLVRARPTPALR